jgi:hypothetical protein
MRAYIIGFLISFLAALLIGTGWYALFGYDHTRTILENIIGIYVSYSFWSGVGIWTILYTILFAFPIIFLKNKSYSEIK